MTNPERGGIRPLINYETNKISGMIIDLKILGKDRFGEIIRYAAADIAPRQITLMGTQQSKIISNDLLKNIGRLPEDQRESKISILIDMIPDAVNTVVLHYPQIKQFIVKKPTTQELTSIITSQRDNREVWINILADLSTGRTKRQMRLDDKTLEETLKTLRGGNLFEELINTEIVIQRSSKP